MTTHTGEHRTANGNVPLKWLVGALTTLLGALLWLYVQDVKDDTKRVESEHATYKRDNDIRLGGLEGRVYTVEANYLAIKAQLDRIEKKVDR